MAAGVPITKNQMMALGRLGYKPAEVSGWTSGRAGLTLGRQIPAPGWRGQVPSTKEKAPIQANKAAEKPDHVDTTLFPQVVGRADVGGVLVDRCCYCGQAHQHRSWGFVEKGCVASGLSFTVVRSYADTEN